MVPQCKSGEAGNFHVPQRGCKLLPVSEEVCTYRDKLSKNRVWYYLWVSGVHWGSWSIFPEDEGGTTVHTLFGVYRICDWFGCITMFQSGL